MTTSLDQGTLKRIDELLQPADERFAQRYPGADGGRQPVHTVYIPADQYGAGVAEEWGHRARAALADAGGAPALLDSVGVPDGVRDAVATQVEDKLDREPIEDLRIDFEDGYGDHGDAEDDVVHAVAQTLRTELADGSCPPFVGIRFKSFARATRPRGLRTLDLFLTTLGASGRVPDGLVLTLPMVTSVEEVQAMVTVCRRIEEIQDWRPGVLRFEIQVETPQAILGADGSALIARMIQSGQGRVSGLHYGTYDYSAELGIAAAYQSMEHPVADQAKAVMQVAAAGTGVRLSDGSTNVLPVGEPPQVQSAWQLHGRLVRRSLERGFYQGWDLHPAQLPSRYAATYAFYREGFPAAAARLRAYAGQGDSAVLDEPATARSLAGFLQRGVDCGAVNKEEVHESAGMTPADLAIVAGDGGGSR